MVKMERKETSHRQDVACSRCRERKTKCSREKPACESCRGDNIECDYSVPEKRVNHTKLLCRNFDRLEVRLNSIEGELSLLTTLLKAESSQQVTANSESTHVLEEYESLPDHSQAESTTHGPPTPRRIIRGQDGQGDQYHGPGTLLSLCYELRDSVLSKESIATPDDKNNATGSERIEDPGADSDHSTRHDSWSSFSGNGRYTDLLERICIMASFEPPLEGEEEDRSIRLPPRQLLLMALPQFLSQVDYSTDIFVEAHLTATIERTYSGPSAQVDDAWAICFNTIILLVLGSENWTKGNDPLMVSQFAVPFFQSMRGALQQAKFLTTPRLINVQALILLSIAAERHYSSAISTSIFAQACLLARRTGLHQVQVTSPNISEDEFQERCKTFMSLHLRDKTLSLTMSSICWLPSFDHGPSPHIIPSTFADPYIVERTQLAEIQEQLYHYLAVAPKHRGTKKMADIHQNLEKWAKGHDLHALPLLSTHEAEIRLTFLMTRMLAYSCSPDEARQQAILDDARASCLILLIAYEKHNQNMVSMLQTLGHTSKGTRTVSTGLEPNLVGVKSKSSLAGRLTSLINAFPVLAFFQLTKNILCSQEAKDTAQTDNVVTSADLTLLRDVHGCMVEVNSRTPSPNRASQVERIFGNMLELVQLMKCESLDQSPAFDIVGASPHAFVQEPSLDLLPNTDTSWAFLNSPFPDPMLNLNGPPDNSKDTRRKRPRIDDMDFSIHDNSLNSFFPSGWNHAIN